MLYNTPPHHCQGTTPYRTSRGWVDNVLYNTPPPITARELHPTGHHGGGSITCYTTPPPPSQPGNYTLQTSRGWVDNVLYNTPPITARELHPT